MNFTPRFLIEDDDLDLVRRFTAYMEKVVYNARIDYLRSQDYLKKENIAKQLLADDLITYEDPLPATDSEFDIEDERLAAAYYRLTPMRRQILKLTFDEGLSAEDAADRLNCPVKYVYNHKHEALKRLRNLLMESGDGHGE